MILNLFKAPLGLKERLITKNKDMHLSLFEVKIIRIKFVKLKNELITIIKFTYGKRKIVCHYKINYNVLKVLMGRL